LINPLPVKLGGLITDTKATGLEIWQNNWPLTPQTMDAYAELDKGYKTILQT
jgi:hypothetical protein